MFLIPYKRIRISTTLTPDEASQRILETVDTTGWTWHRSSDKYFRGRISPESFRMLPVIRGRSLYLSIYLPLVRGQFRPGGIGTELEVTFSLRPFAIASIVFLVGMSLWDEYSKFGGLTRKIVPLLSAFLIFHVLSYLIDFLPEARRAESLLRNLLGDYE
jgi:hypothetical protein